MSRELTSTGIPALDMFLRGGLPKGFTTLVFSPAGGGAEIFAKQFAAGQGKENVVFISTDENEDEIREAANDGGWGFDGVEIVDIQTAFANHMLASEGPEETREVKDFDPRALVEDTSSKDVLVRGLKTEGAGMDYLGQLIAPYEQKKRPDRLIIHSLDFFLSLYTPEKVAAVLTALKAANANSGGQMLLVCSKGAHGEKVERRLELLADCLIELETSRKGTSFERFFLVRKVKNRPDSVGVSTYELTNKGFTLETLERIV